MPVEFFNIHTHHPAGREGRVEIVNLRFGQAAPPATYYSAGLHPWYLSENTLAPACDWLAGQAGRAEVLAIGEAGLDKAAATPWPLQMEAFQHCIAVSENVRKPLIIHCVRAFAEIVALKKQCKAAQPWIFHGFDKKRQMAESLLQAGCYLSYGTALFLEKHPAAQSLQATPGDRFFLETDDADADIETVYRQAAALRGLSAEDLAQIQKENFGRLFKL